MLIQTNHDHLMDVYSYMKGNLKHIQRFLGEIVHHDRTTIEFRHDGSILITPRPRPQLPNHIISTILDHLSDQQVSLYECSLVNQQFYSIANPLVWKLVAKSFEKYHEQFTGWISDASPQQLASVGQYINELRLFGSYWADAHLVRLLPSIPHLERMTICNSTRITETIVQHIPFFCQHLRYLDLRFTGLTQASFSAIGQHCDQLCELKWDMKQYQSPGWLDKLTGCCPLERLSIYSTHVPLNKNTMTIIKNFATLTHLTIHHTPVIDTRPLLGISYNIIAAATFHLPQLKVLQLKPSNHIDDATLLGFIKAHPHLTIISLGGATELTDIGLDFLAKQLANLTQLYISGNQNITPNGIRKFIRHSCSMDLVVIRLDGCHPSIKKAFLESVSIRATTVTLERNVIQKIKHGSTTTRTLSALDLQSA